MKRKIVKIDRELCNGCGVCVTACHEGALRMINGKAELVTDSYCDGLGACLPECPTGAITIVEREAAAFDEAAVAAAQAMKHPAAPAPVKMPSTPPPLACGCPGMMAKSIDRKTDAAAPAGGATAGAAPAVADTVSELRQWPCQIKLVPVNAPYLKNARLLIAADCTAFAYAKFHQDYMKGRITLIGCPKLDDGDYAEKLAAIFQNNELKSILVLRMEVPCCGGLVQAVARALEQCGKTIPWRVVTLGTDGTVYED